MPKLGECQKEMPLLARKYSGAEDDHHEVRMHWSPWDADETVLLCIVRLQEPERRFQRARREDSLRTDAGTQERTLPTRVAEQKVLLQSKKRLRVVLVVP